MNLKDYKPTERFSTKAHYYHYRPDYPHGIIEKLMEDINFSPGFVVADIGAGTGKLTKLFVDNGNKVFAVEPNKEMLTIADDLFKHRNNYHSVNTCAEDTNLRSESIDLISVGQALHWFDFNKAKREFLRILKKPGFALVTGNRPVFVDKKLAEEINTLTGKFCYKTYKRIDFEVIDYDEIFKPFKTKAVIITRKIQKPVSDIIKGTLSCSFSPDEGHKDFTEFVDALRSILMKYAFNNMVRVNIETKMTYGRMK